MIRIFLLALLCICITGCGPTVPSVAVDRNNDPASIRNMTWQWEATTTPSEKITVPNPERYTILFTADGKVQAVFDCNRGGGNYKATPGTLEFGPLMSTRAACPEGSLDGLFMRDLARVRSFFVENKVLYLELEMHSGTMQFRAAP